MITSNVELQLPTDAELERLAGYVSGSMSSADAAAFDRQLDTDAEFFYRMAPMLDVWYSTEPLPKAKRTSTGVTLRLHVPGMLVRYGQVAAAASVVIAMVLYNPVSTTVMERVAFGPTPTPVAFTHRRWQPLKPSVTAVASVPDRPKPRLTAPQQIVAVAPSPTFPTTADSAITIDSLAPAHAMDIRVDQPFDPHGTIIAQWERPLPGEPAHSIQVGGILRAVGDRIAGLWNKIVHPTKDKPKQPPPAP